MREPRLSGWRVDDHSKQRERRESCGQLLQRRRSNVVVLEGFGVGFDMKRGQSGRAAEFARTPEDEPQLLQYNVRRYLAVDRIVRKILESERSEFGEVLKDRFQARGRSRHDHHTNGIQTEFHQIGTYFGNSFTKLCQIHSCMNGTNTESGRIRNVKLQKRRENRARE